jgi:cellulose biosynthesis protein BcsQ
MAVALTEEKVKQFEALFALPSIETMLALDSTDFEHFVAHVFTCAGYIVQHVGGLHFPHGPGVDLNIFEGQIGKKPVARVEVRKYKPSNILDFDDIVSFLGRLNLAGGVPGYLVTTSDFNANAYAAAAAANGQVHLVNGKRLLRYIAYVGGSRLNGEYAGAKVPSIQPISPLCLTAGEVLAKRLQQPSAVRILTVANNKGGVAKTTTALNLGFALSRSRRNQPGKRVLLVDMDGQTSLTHALPPPGLTKGNAPPERSHLADYFRGRLPLADLARPTGFSNLFLLPAHRDLFRLDSGGFGRPDAELAFITDLRQLTHGTADGKPPRYDWIILDTPPAQSFYTRIAVAAADHLLIPACAETFAALGINGLLETAQSMDALMSDVGEWKRQVLGCVITRWKPTEDAEGALATLRTELDGKRIRLLQSHVPQDERVENGIRETVGGGLRNIFRRPGRPGPAAQAYDKLLQEVLEHASHPSAKADGRRGG